MRRSLLALAVVLAGLSLPACFIVVEHGSTTTSSPGSSWSSGPEHKGSGVAAHETRTVSAFSKITGGDTVAFDVRIGSPASLTVHGDDNLLPFVRTEVEDGQLKVSMEPGSYEVKEPLRVEIVMPSLESCAMGGAGETRIAGLDGHDLRLEISGVRKVTASGQVAELRAQLTGATELVADDVRAKKLALDMSGTARASIVTAQVARIELTGATQAQIKGLETGQVDVSMTGTASTTIEGRLEALEAKLTGASQLRADKLQVQRANVSLSGTSQASVRVIDDLAADVSGAASLRYAGDPQRLRTKASGTGTVKALP